MRFDNNSPLRQIFAIDHVEQFGGEVSSIFGVK